MPDVNGRQKVLVVGAGPVGALAALYAAGRGDEVAVYELRDGNYWIISYVFWSTLFSSMHPYYSPCPYISSSGLFSAFVYI